VLPFAISVGGVSEGYEVKARQSSRTLVGLLRGSRRGTLNRLRGLVDGIPGVISVSEALGSKEGHVGGAERGSVLDGVHCENSWYLTWWLVGDLIQIV
jgi:hypothetical protein